MSKKHFSWLLLLTVLAAVVLLLLPGKTGRDGMEESTLLLPELQGAVNEVAWLRISAAGGAPVATLERREDHWVVAEANGYRADWDKLRRLLSDLAQAEIVEPKTANPDYYDRLGVEDVSEPDAAGRLIEFDEDSGLQGVIVGKTAQERGGQYVRPLGQAASALIDRRLDLPADTAGWMEQEIVDIPEDEVLEIEVLHPDGESVRARRSAVDEEHFVLDGIPEGREKRSDWAVDSLANNLAALKLEAVRVDEGIDWDEASTFRLVTAAGLQLEADLAMDEGAEADSAADDEHWIRLRAGTYTTAVDSGVDAEANGQQLLDRAAAINRRVSGWVYRIPKYKYDAMAKRREDLLKPLDS
jgi:hypothetical protein